MSPPLSPSAPVSNDNAWQPPVVHVPARRPEAAYAASENLILPLRFARRLPEWSRDRIALRPLDAVWRSREARVTRTFNRLFSK